MGDLIELRSEQGQRLLDEVKSNEWPYQPYLHAIFCKEVNRSACGLVSCAHIMSAHHLGNSSGDHDNNTGLPTIDSSKLPFTEDTMYTYPATLAATSKEKVDSCGLTLDEISQILSSHGRKNTIFFANDTTADEFRSKAIDALQSSDSKKGVIINYHMGTLGQGTLYGHHSVLAAYHRQTDRFLLLDTWPDTQSCWAKAQDFYIAMDTIDSDSKKKRGFCIMDE